MGLAEAVLKAVEEPVDFKFLYDLQVCKLCSFTLHHSFILTSVIVCFHELHMYNHQFVDDHCITDPSQFDLLL